jgi:hypothetical protein
VADHPRAAGPVRRRFSEQGRSGHEGGKFKDEIV